MLTLDRFKALLHYDPLTGEFTRKVATNNGRKVGSRAGNIRTDGYLSLCIDQHVFPAHRGAWFYMTGEWPTLDIDHIDGVKSNNRWANLRQVTEAENSQNQRRPAKTNKLGLLGVHYKPHMRKYVASITVAGKNRYLGSFAEPMAAHQAYLDAKRQYHPGCTI